jgi:hypothetical protein
MFSSALALHSIVRWVVVLAGLWAAGRGIAAWIGARPWTAADDRAARLFVLALDLQVLIGLVLYSLVSPITTGAFRNMGSVMQNEVLRFWVAEHPTAMVLALAFAHVGRVRVRRASDGAVKRRRAAIFFGLALLLVLLGTPWPFSAVARPLWRAW